MRTIYFTSESERRAVLPDATEDEVWRKRTGLEMPDDDLGDFAPVCDRIHLKTSQQSKVPLHATSIPTTPPTIRFAN